MDLSFPTTILSIKLSASFLLIMFLPFQQGAYKRQLLTRYYLGNDVFLTHAYQSYMAPSQLLTITHQLFMAFTKIIALALKMIFNTSLLTITIQQVAIQPCKGVGVVWSEKVWLILFSVVVLLYHQRCLPTKRSHSQLTLEP